MRRSTAALEPAAKKCSRVVGKALQDRWPLSEVQGLVAPRADSCFLNFGFLPGPPVVPLEEQGHGAEPLNLI